MIKRSWLPLVGILVVLAISSQSPAAQPSKPPETSAQQRQEEALDYFEKWLKEDAVYIISEEEKAVFLKLTTAEEKEQFIEQFWLRRDPDPRTSSNEFKEEHYRRIAYANERFSAGWPGWKTDRGRAYIVHGPPDELTEHAGGQYERTLHEGGGRTAAYPFEVWRYRHIEGIGDNIELQFVDRDGSGVYRLAITPDEKDAFMMTPDAGFTAAEELGLAERIQRPFLRPYSTYPLMNYGVNDSLFARYETFVGVQRPTKLKYEDLKTAVDTRIEFQQIPFLNEVSFFEINDQKLLVPITLEVGHPALTFVQGNGRFEAKLAVYGAISDLGNRLVAEFEDEISITIPEAEFEQRIQRSTLYQKIVFLEKKQRYKLNLVIKDLNSHEVGSVSRGLAPPNFSAEHLTMSSIVLSDFIRPVSEADRENLFVLGDVQVRPLLERQTTSNNYLAAYVQIHRVAFDQSSGNPSFEVRYRIRKDGETKAEVVDSQGETVQYASPRRLVLIARLPTEKLEPGRYQLDVEFTDNVKGETAQGREQFEVIADPR